jgi:DNA polymerase III sliding clamp (beta) subunit (PCNA family)
MVNLQIHASAKPKITIFAKNDFGKINETGALKSTNVEKELSINPIYLLQALKNLSVKNIEIGLDEFDRLIFNEGSYSHILATYWETNKG